MSDEECTKLATVNVEVKKKDLYQVSRLLEK